MLKGGIADTCAKFGHILFSNFHSFELSRTYFLAWSVSYIVCKEPDMWLIYMTRDLFWTI